MTTRYLHQTHLLFAKMCLKGYSDAKKEQKEKKKWETRKKDKKRKGRCSSVHKKSSQDVFLEITELTI